MRRGGGLLPPPFDTPPLVRLVGDACQNLTKFFRSALKVVPGPSEAFLVAFWTDEKPYKCIGSNITRHISDYRMGPGNEAVCNIYIQNHCATLSVQMLQRYLYLGVSMTTSAILQQD